MRAGLLRAEQPLQAYRWSSYPLYLGDGASRPAWLRVDRLLGEWGIRWEQPGEGRFRDENRYTEREGEKVEVLP